MRVDLGARATRLLVARRRSVSAVTTTTLHVRPRAAMASAAAVQRETVGLVVVAVLALVGTWMRLVLLPAGDEGRQPVDVAVGWRVALRLTRLVGLALLVLREGLCVARDIRLRLAGAVRRIGGRANRRLNIVVAVVEATFAHAGRFILRTGEVGVVLPELLLRRGDHAVIVLGVLIVILRRDRITRRLRVARELNIFFCNVRWISANFHVRAVRFVHPHHRVVTLAVIVASAHALVLTVSHGSPVANPFIVTARRRRAALNTSTLFRTSDAEVRALARSSRRQMRRRPPQCQVPCREAATPCPRHTAALPSSSSQACPRRSRISAEPMKYPIPIGRTTCRVIRRPSFASSAPSALRSPAPGLAIGAHSLGSIPERNLVGLDPQSKCFFSYQECGALMAAPAKQGPGRCPQDRTVAQLVRAPLRRGSRSRGRADPARIRAPGCRQVQGGARRGARWRDSRRGRRAPRRARVADRSRAPRLASPQCRPAPRRADWKRGHRPALAVPLRSRTPRTTRGRTGRARRRCRGHNGARRS